MNEENKEKDLKQIEEEIQTQQAFIQDQNQTISGNTQKNNEKEPVKTEDIFVLDKDHKVKKIVERENTQYRYTKLSNFVLRLSKFYAPMPLWKLGLITCGLAIIFGIVSVFFVKNPGIYNFGLAAFGQAIARLTNVLLRANANVTEPIYRLIDHALFWILYLLMSIPIFIFGWKKVGKVFTLLTIEFLVVQSLVSFGIGQIPGVDNFYIIGNFDHTRISAETREAITNALWSNKDQLWSLIPLEWNEGGAIIAQIIFSFSYGLMLAIFFAIIAIIGGSAGVTGIIGEYMSTVKHKNFGTINGYLNFFIMIISVAIGTYLTGSLLVSDLNWENVKNLPGVNLADEASIKQLNSLNWKLALYFSPNFISTFICNFVFVVYLNKLFPRFKIVQCKVYSPHMSAIKEAIISDNKTINSFTITIGEGGYSGNKTKVLSSITLYKQVPRLIKKVREVDKNALITINNIASVDGNLYLPENKF